MKQLSFESAICDVDEDESLSRVTVDFSYLELTGDFVAEAKTILTGEKVWKCWWRFHWLTTCTLSSNKLYCLSVDDKSIGLWLGRWCSSLELYGFLSLAAPLLSETKSFIFSRTALSWIQLPSLWWSGYGVTRAVWQWGIRWQVWIHDSKPARRLEVSFIQEKQFLGWVAGSLLILGIDNFIALFSPLFRPQKQNLKEITVISYTF